MTQISSFNKISLYKCAKTQIQCERAYEREMQEAKIVHECCPVSLWIMFKDSNVGESFNNKKL